MHALVALFFLFAQPFWEARPPEQWTYREIETLRTKSPWAQDVGPAPPVLVYFATASPIENAERELRLRGRKPQPEPDPDYSGFLNDNRANAFVLAIPYPRPIRFGTAEDQSRMEEENEMVVDRKSYRILGHFPPTPGDPVLRLVFPRQVDPQKKNVVFRLFLPGMPFPEREVEFRPRDLMYHGKLEM